MKNFTPGKIGCRAPQVCLPTYSPHLSSPASRTQGRIEMLTASLQQEGRSQDASPGSLRPCKHPELPSSWPRPRTEGASAFALLREHQHRFRLPHPPPPETGWVTVAANTTGKRQLRGPKPACLHLPKSLPVPSAPSLSRVSLLQHHSPRHIPWCLYPELKKVALELQVHANPCLCEK